MPKIHFRHKSLEGLQALEPLNAPRLEDRIYKEILVGGQDFTPETASDHKSGIELLGQLFKIHHEFQQEAGEWEDMFGEYLEDSFKLNSSTSQFFTPMCIVRMMLMMNISDDDLKKPEPQRICDPCCGSGRFMLGVAERYAQSIGALNFLIVNVDLDFRAFVYCCMNAILHQIPSVTVWGNSLSNEVFDAYIVGIPGLQPWVRLEKDKARRLILPVSKQVDIHQETAVSDHIVEPNKLIIDVPHHIVEPNEMVIEPLSSGVPQKKSVQVGLDQW